MINAWYYVDVKKCMASVKDSVYIIVDSMSKPQIQQHANTLTATTATSYEWYRDGVKIDKAGDKSLRIDGKGYYSVKISNQSGCVRMSEPEFFMPISGKEKTPDFLRIKCSPNPSNGLVSVLVSEVPDKPSKLAVYDKNGRILFTTFVTGNITQLNLLKQSKGLYYVEVDINNKKNIVPVVLQ